MERLLTLYSEVQSTDVRWLWYPFIAIGKITLLQGDPGDGKSTMMMNLIAELSTGGKTPDGCKIGAPQKVIYQCSEDGVSDTIKPRLERCGADCRKIAFINEEAYNGLTLDDERIRQAIIEFRPRLVVIDPIQAYLGSDSDLQIAGRARKLMRRLGMWAAGVIWKPGRASWWTTSWARSQRIMGIAALPMSRNITKQLFRRRVHGLHILWHPAAKSAVCRILW